MYLNLSLGVCVCVHATSLSCGFICFFSYSLTIRLMKWLLSDGGDPVLATGLDSSGAENSNKYLMYLKFVLIICASHNYFMLVNSP